MAHDHPPTPGYRLDMWKHVGTLVRAVVVLIAGMLLGNVGDLRESLATEIKPAAIYLVIPEGAFAAELAGTPNAGLPGLITARVGQELVIRNDDVAMHYLLGKPLIPGQAVTFKFDAPGNYQESGGLSCSLANGAGTLVSVLP